MFRHQNQFSMSIFDKVFMILRFLWFTLAAILNLAHNKQWSRVTKWHQAVLGSVASVLPESPKKRCMYSETHLGHKFVFCHQTICFFGIYQSYERANKKRSGRYPSYRKTLTQCWVHVVPCWTNIKQTLVHFLGFFGYTIYILGI